MLDLRGRFIEVSPTIPLFLGKKIADLFRTKNTSCGRPSPSAPVWIS
jgi:hypothetical protein